MILTRPKAKKTEAGRLRALIQYDILDTNEDPNFNDFVALAAAACNAPIAFINFVDSHRTWTKASFGHEVVELPRHGSFCAHSILQNDTLVIQDTLADERFSNNELILGQSKIRFYAGSPIVTSEGYAIGAVSVMGTEPRQLTSGQHSSLRAIARQVITELELRRRLAREYLSRRDLALSDALEFKTVFEGLPHGVAKLDLSGRFIDSNSVFLSLLGYSKEDLCQLTEHGITHADDLVSEGVTATYPHVPSTELSKLEKRYLTKNASVIWVRVSGIVVKSEGDSESSVLLAIEDITSVKELEAQAQKAFEGLERAKLFASEKLQHMEDLFENMHEGVLLQDSSARTVRLNRAAMQILGLSADEVASPNILALHRNTLKADGNPLEAEEHPIVVALKTGKPQLQVPIIVKKNDGKSHVTVNAVPLFREGDAAPRGVVCTVSNFTQLQAQKIELENTLKVIPAGLYRMDQNGKCTYINEKWCEWSGLTPQEVVDKGWMAGMHPEDLERVLIGWNASTGAESQFESTYRLLRADKTVLHVQATAVRLPEEDGSSGWSYLLALQDITSLREAEVLNNFYKTSMDTAAIVAFMDNKGRITYANNLYCEISGYSREELQGSKHRMLDSGLSGKFPSIKTWESMDGPKKWHGEICGQTKSGTEYWVATTVVPVFGADHKVERFMSLGRDITQQKHQQQELAAAYKKAEQATSAKSEFLSTMSHEIRTPLNGVIGMTSLLQETALTPEQIECVEAISSSGKILLSIINNVLDFSKIEAGKVEIEETEFDLENYVRELIKPLQYQAQKKGIGFILECSNYENRVLGDDGKIGQIITNLVSNAIKFTAQGSVKVHAHLEAKGRETSVTLSVSDTGIGIPEFAIGQMFQPFSQAEKSTNRTYGGTGLGLSISKRLVELMNGTIGLNSEFGKGTTFTVQLSLKTGRAIEKAAADDARLKGLTKGAKSRPRLLGRVLIAEDNTTNQKVIARMLEKWNCKYHVVADGVEVLEMLRDAHFDLILMDCQMPEMDGYTTTRLIRQSALPSRKIPIVALTANAVSGDETLCVQSGMDGYLTKPVDMSDLEVVLLKYLKVDHSEKAACEL